MFCSIAPQLWKTMRDYRVGPPGIVVNYIFKTKPKFCSLNNVSLQFYCVYGTVTIIISGLFFAPRTFLKKKSNMNKTKKSVVEQYLMSFYGTSLHKEVGINILDVCGPFKGIHVKTDTHVLTISCSFKYWWVKVNAIISFPSAALSKFFQIENF